MLLKKLKKISTYLQNYLNKKALPKIHALSKGINKRISKWSKWKRIIIALNVFFAIFFIFILSVLFMPMPAIENFRNRNIPESTKIYDRTGKILLYDMHGSMRRTEVPLSEISEYMKKATIASEDKDFYEHKGFSPTAILRAFKANLATGTFSQGGSTITQQLVKNSLLSNEKTISRKIKEIIFSMRLEKRYTKDEILEAYLNEAPYGGVIYGVEEASQYFFGVNAKDLSLAQSAYLSTLPKRPTYYSPYGKNRELLDKRKNLTLLEMKEDKIITEEEYNKATNEVVTFSDAKSFGIKAPHFVFYIKQLLLDKYGEEVLNRGGLKVITTLDWDLEKKAEELLTKKALENSKKLNASNAGLVAIDPKSGQILAMVGSRGYFDEKIDGKVNIAVAKRQPGSAFKPFVYAAAFKKGYTPETVVFDLKTQFSTRCSPSDFTSNNKCYSPSNFNNKVHGPINLRSALAQSVNIASVKVLYLAGINNSIDTAEGLGLTTLSDRGRFGLSLVLGGGEVTLLEMTSAYGVFANEGIRNSAVGILEVKNSKGEILETYSADEKRVLDTEVARTISDILSDNVARTPEFGANSPLYFPNADVAAKTGTTNDFRDAWIIGYNGAIVIGVWAGNNDNTPMKSRIAEFSAAPLWHEVMAYAMKKYSSTDFTEPSSSADLADLPEVLRGNWNQNPSLGIHDILYWVNKDNPQDNTNASLNDPQLALWDYPVQIWAQANVVDEPLSTTTSELFSTSTELSLSN